MLPIVLLVVGDAARDEFAAALAPLDKAVRISLAPTVAAALDWMDRHRDDGEPDMIAVLQARPGEIPQQVILALQAAAPLARVVGLLGAWCEGEARSGHPWPGVERVYWHQFADWISTESNAHRRQGIAVAGTDIEPCGERDDHALASARGLVLVVAPLAQSRTWLADVCRSAGAAATLSVDGECASVGVSAAIVDIDLWNDDGERLLRRVVRRLSDVSRGDGAPPILALLSYPRAADARRARAAGADAVMAKPLEVAALRVWLSGVAAVG